MKHPALALGLLVTFVSFGASAQTPCQDDFDCKRNQTCSAGRCQAKPAASPAATQDEAADRDGDPADASPPGTETRRDKGLMIGGIVCTGVGGLVLLTGLTMLLLADADSTEVCSGNDCHQATQSDRDTLKSTGTVASIVGAGLAVVGIPMIVIGARKRSGRAPSGPQFAVLPGPKGAAVTVRF